jgi:hypothetical protein
MKPQHLITKIIPYVDTLGFLVKRSLSKNQFRRLKSTCGGIQRISRKPKSWFSQGIKYELQQPSRWTYEYLHELDRAWELEIYINEIHLAIDYITRTKRRAEELDRFFRKHIVKRFKRTWTVGHYESTWYGEGWRKWGRENWTIYADKLDRHTGLPCVHAEVRITGAAALHRLGIYGPYQVLGFDFREFFERKLCFKKIDLIALAEVFPDKRMRDDDASKLKRGELLVERAMYEANDTCESAQAVECFMKKHLKHLDAPKRKRHIDRVLTRINNHPFLPLGNQ